jgi:hypothetical protein
MSKMIKNFSEFQKINEDGPMDFITNLLGSGATAVGDVIKGKVSDYLLGFFGVKPESLFGTIIRNFAETVDVSELYDFIIKGEGGISVKTLAPKLTDVTMETITELGVDGLATRFKIEDKNGWVYRTIKEMISNSAKQATFRENILNFWTMILTSIAGGENKDPFAKVKSGKNPFELTPDEEKKISTNPAVKQAEEKSGMDVTSILKGMMGGATNPSGAFSTVGGQ